MYRRLAVTLLFTGAIWTLASSLPTEETPAKNGGETPLEEKDFSSRYSKETIEEHRMMSLDRTNGEESYQTDEEVIRILEIARAQNSSFLYSSPSAPGNSGPEQEQGDRERRAIIGSDNRYRISSTSHHPACAIGELVSSRGTGYCTVFRIGPYHAITAGHCVYNTTTRRYYTNLDVYFGRTCYTRGDHADVLRVSLYTAYRVRGDLQHDIALLLLDRYDLPDRYSSNACILGFAYQQPMPTITASVCGYPYDRTYWYHQYDCMYCSDGIARRACFRIGRTVICNDNYIAHTSDTFAGMDGGPLMTNRHPGIRNYIAYGVYAGWVRLNGVLYNRSTRFTVQKFTDICLWLRANGATCNARGI